MHIDMKYIPARLFREMTSRLPWWKYDIISKIQPSILPG